MKLLLSFEFMIIFIKIYIIHLSFPWTFIWHYQDNIGTWFFFNTIKMHITYRQDWSLHASFFSFQRHSPYYCILWFSSSHTKLSTTGSVLLMQVLIFFFIFLLFLLFFQFKIGKPTMESSRPLTHKVLHCAWFRGVTTSYIYDMMLFVEYVV
jgi:hypothetical protein